MCECGIRLSWQEWRTPQATWQIRIVTPCSHSIRLLYFLLFSRDFILTTLAPLRQIRKLPFWGESLLRKLHLEITWLSGQILGSDFISYKNNAFRWWQESVFPWKTIFWKSCRLECIIGPLLRVLSWRVLGLIVTSSHFQEAFGKHHRRPRPWGQSLYDPRTPAVWSWASSKADPLAKSIEQLVVWYERWIWISLDEKLIECSQVFRQIAS